MADTKFQDASHVTSLDGDEAIPIADDPSGSPTDGYITPDDLGAYISPTAINGLELSYNSATSISVGTGDCWSENGDKITVTSAITKSSLSLSTSTWYHVYVYIFGGSALAEVLTTAPVVWTGTAYGKTGSTSRRYVGSIKSDGSGNVIPFVHMGDMMVYKLADRSTSPLRVVSAGTATTATAIGMTGAIPVTSRLVDIRVSNSSDGVLYTSEDSSVSSSQFTAILGAGNAATKYGHLMHAMNSSQQIYYLLSGRTTGAMYLDVIGYKFDR